MIHIPKHVFFYWGAPVVPYLRYMCFKSFRQFHPDWKMTLFVPAKLTTTQSWSTFENKQTFNTKDYSNRLDALGINICPFDMETIGFSNDISEVIKSDIIRLYLLSTVGGLWSDSDIIYFRPILHTLKETEHTTYLCFRRGGPTQENIPKNGPRYHSIGFLAGCPGNKYFKQLYANAKNVINPELYQSVGSTYYKTQFNDNNIDSLPEIYNIDVNMVYPSRAVPGMYNDANYYKTLITHLTIGWHWYCGHPQAGELQNKIVEENYNSFDNIICWLIDKVNRNVKV